MENTEVEYYMNAASKNDCFFIVGPESGPTERIGSFKIILMAHSEPFRKMLEDHAISEKVDINLPDIEPKTFKDFLKCLYGGCDIVLKELSFDECGKMLYITEKYLVKQIKKKVISRLLKFLPLTLDHLFTGLSNPVYFDNDKLKTVFAEKLFKNTKEIFYDKRFLSLDDEALMIIVKQDLISVPEIIVWKAVLKWGIHKSNSDNGKVVREKISPLLEFIRFGSMDLKEFYESVIPSNVLTSDEAIELSTSLVNNSCHNISGICQNSRSRFVQQEQVAYLHYYVNNVNELIDDERYYSEPVELGEFSWKICIEKNSADFMLCIECSKILKVDQNSSWECCAALEYVLVNQNGKLNKQDFSIGTYNSEVDVWGDEFFIEWNDLIDPAKGFIKENNIIVMARVKLISTK